MGSGFESKIYDIVKVLLYSLVISMILLTFVFRMIIVNGSSMMNTLQSEDRVMVVNYYQHILEPKAGDIVAISPFFTIPDEEKTNTEKFDMPIIKRIIATEGQTIGFDAENGLVYVDGKVIEEPYILTPTKQGVQWEIPDVIPPGKVFVMGDNREVSLDSRSEYIALIDVHQIIGKALYTTFPFSAAGYLY